MRFEIVKMSSDNSQNGVPSGLPDQAGTDNQVKQSEGVDVNHQSAQAVESLPPILADDIILKELLGNNLSQTDLSQYQNVTPLQVTYNETPLPDVSGMITQNVHNDKQVKYDPKKGVLSSSWASYVFNSKDQNNMQLTNQKDGLFIRHLTSTVVNPHSLIGADQSKQPLPSTSINVISNSYCSSQLQANNWSNVVMYKPEPKVFKIDLEKDTSMMAELIKNNIDPNLAKHN